MVGKGGTIQQEGGLAMMKGEGGQLCSRCQTVALIYALDATRREMTVDQE